MVQFIAASLIASGFWMLLELGRFLLGGIGKEQEPAGVSLGPGREYVERYAEAFYRLAESYQGMPKKRERLGDEEMEHIFQQLRDRQCTQCSCQEECWGDNYYEVCRRTYRGLKAMEEGETAVPEELKDFSRVCCRGSQMCIRDRARSAQEQAKENLSRQDLEAQIQSGTLCHGDYHYHHVLFLNPGVATVHFEKCRFDFPVQDLYQFMRKILEKHGWELSLGERMLSAYDGIRRLSETELKILRLRMAYPEKFWKLANHYYGSSKAWIPVRYQQKLELLNRQQKQKNNFLKILE